MLTNTMEITNKLYEEVLKNNEDLTQSKAVITKGYPGTSRLRFPFIVVNYPGYRENLIQAVSGMLMYSFEIFVGVKNLVPGVAYSGNDSGKKGVTQICNDIANIVKGNSLQGTFIIPAHNIQIDPKFMFDDGETLVVGKVSFEAGVWFKH